MWGVANVTQDWPLIDHLWMGYLPQKIDETDQLGSWERCIGCAAKNFRSFSWPQLPHPRIGWMYHRSWPVHNCWWTHDSLGHCGWDKLLSALHVWLAMHADVANCVWHCLVCQWEKPPAPPKEELHWMDKGGTPFIR